MSKLQTFLIVVALTVKNDKHLFMSHDKSIFQRQTFIELQENDKGVKKNTNGML